jgi:hypothetical protein
MRLEGLGQLKNPLTSGIERTTFVLVAQCLNVFRNSVLNEYHPGELFYITVFKHEVQRNHKLFLLLVPIYKGVDRSLVSNYRPPQFNLSGLQVNGTRYCVVPEENVG